MTLEGLDDLDRCILYSLQENAREKSASSIAERVDVSARTVRNRIHRLEERGIITGYSPEIDYEKSGYQLHTLVFCTAPIPDRERLAREVLDVPGVVGSREIMTGHRNLQIEIVGRDSDDLSRITRDLSELGLQVDDEDIIRNEYHTPFHGFDRFDPDDRDSCEDE